MANYLFSALFDLFSLHLMYPADIELLRLLLKWYYQYKGNKI